MFYLDDYVMARCSFVFYGEKQNCSICFVFQAVMRSLGNETANTIWEATLHMSRNYRKPDSNSSQEEKERFIIAKYNQKEFLQPLPPSLPVTASLADGLFRLDFF